MAWTSSPSTSKRKHNIHTVEKKLDIISTLDKGETAAYL